jgi:zinc transport system permease protein
MNEPLLIALLSGGCLSLLLAPLGCYLLWQRMAFLGDTLSHSAILGIALSVLFHFPFYHLGTIIYLVGFVFLFDQFAYRKSLSNDTALSLLSYGGMSFGLVILHFCGQDNALSQILFGDLLSMDYHNLAWLACLSIVVNIYLNIFHKKLILYLLDSELAQQSGLNIKQTRMLFLFVSAVVIAVAIHWVGALIAPALLIIPCTAVFSSTASPQETIKKALLFSLFSFPIGVLGSFYFSLPIGPTIVCAFILILVIKWQLKKLFHIQH